MRIITLLFIQLTTLLSASLVVGAALNSTNGSSSILINPPQMALLPSPSEATQAAAAASLNLSNIQGDIIVGMKKKTELFAFFAISDSVKFKQGLKQLSSKITSARQIIDSHNELESMINIGLSQTGLTALGVTDSLNDTLFSAGQFADATALGDVLDRWAPVFKGTSIHGVYLIASRENDVNDRELQKIQHIFDSSMVVMHSVRGQTRPGDQQGHEHFGFMDGISQPSYSGLSGIPTPGQAVLDAGQVILGATGDVVTRPSWAKDGSILAFRQLKQLVPEFNKYLTDNPIVENGLTPQQGSELLGARMVGRWKSGAPIDLAPLADDPDLATDPQRNNNFTFLHPGEDNKSNQTRCPFSAHVRKVKPRGDFSPQNINNHIMRAGIAYGPEVSAQEAQSNTSSTNPEDERGVAFVAYQSQLTTGFHFIQIKWVNNVKFFFDKTDKTPGFDPIVGQNQGQPRVLNGLDPVNPDKNFTLMTDFVQSQGGEYFFTPSISAISTILSSDNSGEGSKNGTCNGKAIDNNARGSDNHGNKCQ